MENETLFFRVKKRVIYLWATEVIRQLKLKTDSIKDVLVWDLGVTHCNEIFQPIRGLCSAQVTWHVATNQKQQNDLEPSWTLQRRFLSCLTQILFLWWLLTGINTLPPSPNLEVIRTLKVTENANVLKIKTSLILSTTLKSRLFRLLFLIKQAGWALSLCYFMI